MEYMKYPEHDADCLCSSCADAEDRLAETYRAEPDDMAEREWPT
ncbi:hypothetical protein AB0467_28670 [Streptomyces sp. NPDC052095]